MSLPVRLAGALDAINGVNPLCNPYLTGPDDLKAEWLLGYSFGQKLSPMDRVRLRLAIMQHTDPKAAGRS